jgi:4-diphosphocytidyl-2-C-methyl-D-erythritol kinase
VNGLLPASLPAPAKLTVSLRVLGTRADGLHLLDVEMVTLDLADTLRLTEGRGVTFVGPYGDDLEAGEDLVTRALGLVGRSAAVEVDKQIPAGAGLGGGSADAGAILRWAGHLDLGQAATLGADVPFCAVGGRARVGGIGEQVTPLPFEDRTYTLVTPPLQCSTPAVYAAWDDLGGPSGENGNDLEPAALLVEPELVQWRDDLAGATGAVPRLAGSGSTWFVEGSHPGEGRRVVRTTPA